MADSNDESTTGTTYTGAPWQTVEPFKSLFAAKISAETARIVAETEKTINERDMSKAALVTITAESQRAVIAAEQARIVNDRELARDKYNHVLRFNGAVHHESVGDVIDELTVWHRTAPACDMEVIFNSPGGEVIAGMDLYDFFGELKAQGHNLTIATRGMAASMGGILLQAGLATSEAPRSKRVMGREASVLLHEPSTFVMGKTGDIEDEMVLLRMIQTRVLNIFATGSQYAFEHGTSKRALTVSQLSEGDKEIGFLGWKRRDVWLDSEDCLDNGLVDELRS